MISAVREQNGITIVNLEGRLDAVAAPEVKTQLQEMVTHGASRMVVNMAGIAFIDSAGLGVLVSCLRRCASEGGDLRLAAVPPFCRSIFELTRLTRVFDVNESEAEAIATLAGT